MDDRIEQARQRIHDAYSHKDTGEMPVLVMDVNYWVSGESPQLIPDDYFTSPARMLEFQLAKINRHLASIQEHTKMRIAEIGAVCQEIARIVGKQGVGESGLKGRKPVVNGDQPHVAIE